MSESLNVNVLVAAKEEYTKQLIYILSPEIYTVILNVFNDSQQLKKKRSISLRNFQLLLKKIPVWNTIIIEKNTEGIKSKIPYLLDLITAIFVSHVKILACVRLKTDSKSIQVKVPNLDTFLHKIIITNAEKIYYNPDIILNKKEIVINLISETIEETIRNQIPIDKILTEYLAGVFDEDSRDAANETKNDLKELEELEELDDQEDEDEEDDEDEEELDDEPEKNIIPTRPLPAGQLSNESNGSGGINGSDGNSASNFGTSGNNESNIPTEEIKNRVLFSDAIEKSVKNPENNNEDSESDFETDSEDYSEPEEDSDDKPVK